MANLADAIEQFILSRILGEREEVTVLKRNELAEQLQCAPSQISYVLSTRFTVERGYLVESRRGSGGFIRIVRVPVRRIVYEDAARQLEIETPPETAESMIGRMQAHGLLSVREANMMLQFLQLTRDRLEVQEQARILRSLLRNLADIKEG